MQPVISPSMMCAMPDQIMPALSMFDAVNQECFLQGEPAVKIGYLHIDIMDGHFVPNFALSPDSCRQMMRYSSIPLDIHLMVDDPEQVMGWLPKLPSETNPAMSKGIISVHVETAELAVMEKCITKIHGKGMQAFAALNPETEYQRLLPFLPILEGVMIMAVHPGFAGQKMVPGTPEKIKACREWLDQNGGKHLSIEVDGNVSPENAILMAKAGADIFVAGTASIFTDGAAEKERLLKMQEAIRTSCC